MQFSRSKRHSGSVFKCRHTSSSRWGATSIHGSSASRVSAAHIVAEPFVQPVVQLLDIHGDARIKMLCCGKLIASSRQRKRRPVRSLVHAARPLRGLARGSPHAPNPDRHATRHRRSRPAGRRRTPGCRRLTTGPTAALRHGRLLPPEPLHPDASRRRSPDSAGTVCRHCWSGDAQFVVERSRGGR